MTLNRRDFVATVGLSLVGGAPARAAAANEPSAVPSVDASSDWAAIRAQFDLAPDWMHFSQFYIVSHPKPVRDAIERYRRQLDTHPFTTVEHGMGFDAFLGEDPFDSPATVYGEIELATHRSPMGAPPVPLTSSADEYSPLPGSSVFGDSVTARDAGPREASQREVSPRDVLPTTPLGG